MTGSGSVESINVGNLTDKQTNMQPISLLLVVVLAALAVVHAQRHNLIIGQRLPGDVRLLTQQVYKDSSILRVVETDLPFNGNRLISFINATDLHTDDDGKIPSITSGGIGQYNLNIHFKSKRGHTINFVVDIYGR